MPKAITCPVILSGASARSDSSLALRFSTPELAPDEKTAFFELLNLNLKMLLQPADSVPAEFKEVKGQFDVKTPSARLRGVIFVRFKNTNAPGEFEDFYRRRMETIIEREKQDLPQQ